MHCYEKIVHYFSEILCDAIVVFFRAFRYFYEPSGLYPGGNIFCMTVFYSRANYPRRIYFFGNYWFYGADRSQYADFFTAQYRYFSHWTRHYFRDYVSGDHDDYRYYYLRLL